MKIKLYLIILSLAAITIGFFWRHQASSARATSTAAAVKKTETKQIPKSQTPQTSAPTACDSNNSGSRVVIVSVSRQHMWACEGDKVAYDNSVITGMQLYPSELTPVGTYHIYSKLTDQTLAGSDFTGRWSDYVNYWMPFLDNQYGTYGFHDLTDTANGANGRAEGDFGNVDINAPYTAAKHGSHGCVELPLSAAKWLYAWSSVGTAVTIKA